MSQNILSFVTSYRNYDVINFNRFLILIKILIIIVSLIPREVIMTSRPDQIKLELLRRISGIIVVSFSDYIAAM